MTFSSDKLLSANAFDDEIISGLTLANADFARKEFIGCKLTGMKLQQSRWSQALLEDCVFESCDLSNLDPKQLRLRDVQFVLCKMIGIDWTHVAEYPVMRFLDCNLSYCAFASIKAPKLRFTRCVLTEASFEQAELQDAVFEDCQLVGARFEGCQLERASFKGSRDLVLNPAANRVRGASIPLEAAVAIAESFGLKISG